MVFVIVQYHRICFVLWNEVEHEIGDIGTFDSETGAGESVVSLYTRLFDLVLLCFAFGSGCRILPRASRAYSCLVE